MKNNNVVVNPKFTAEGGKIVDWEFVAPRDEIAVNYSFIENEKLILSANGDRHSIGWWRGKAELEHNEWYRASVCVRINGVDNPAHSVFAQVAGHALLPKEQTGDVILLEQTFQYWNKEEPQFMEFFLKASKTGSLEFFKPFIIKIPKLNHRVVRVATIRFGESENCTGIDRQRERISRKLDMAGALKPDIVCLPEFSAVIGVPAEIRENYYDIAEAVPDGPTSIIASEKARQYGMYVIVGVVEKRGKHIFNTALIFDREGSFIGQYDKTHLTLHEVANGVSCGDSYRVFDLDFGRIGIHVCYDEWFPEVSRLYAYKGAEILFLPVWGGKPITWRTRALDNGIYFVSAGVNPPSMIIDSSGAIIAENNDDGVVCAELNLDYRKTNVYKDPTLSGAMPCIVPQFRRVVDDNLLDELYKEMKTT